MNSLQAESSGRITKHSPLARRGDIRSTIVICLAVGCLVCFGCRREATEQSTGTLEQSPLSEWFNVLLVSVDTTRADHLGCYGYANAKTPNIDRLAAEGVRFEQCISSSPLTLPSHCTMFTGVYPFVHGARDNGYFKLSSENVTLAEQFQKAGYVTHAQTAAHVMDAKYGLDQGFDTYGDVDTKRALERGDSDKPQLDLPHMSHARVRRADEITRAGIKLLQENREHKFFIFLHYFDPHFPYDAPEPYASQFADPYDGEIAFFDHEFGKLMRALQALELADKTLVILTSDHGESLGEHGEKTHAVFVYDATQRVPLILWCPERMPPGVTVSNQVRLLDLTPTIVDFIGLDLPRNIQGKSLLPCLEGGPDEQRPCYGDSLFCKHSFGYSALRFLRTGGWKYVHSPDPELYHVAEDPAELRDVIDSEPARATAMKEQLRSIIEESPAPPGSRATLGIVEDEDIARLQALGYVSSGPDITEDGSEIDDFKPSGQNPRDQLDVINAMVFALGQFMQGNFAQSELLFRGILDREPGSTGATRGLLLSLLAQRRPKEAIRNLRQLSELEPDSPGLRAVAEIFAGLLADDHQFAEATAQFRVALEEKPGDVRLLEGLATALERTDEHNEACQVYGLITQLEPQRPAVHSKYADLLDRMERHDEAIEIMRQGRAVKPNDASVANNLAWRLATSPQPDLRNGQEALQLAELANGLFPGKHVSLINTLAAAYAAVGRFPHAIAASEEALALARQENDEAAIARTLDFLEHFRRGETIVDRIERNGTGQDQAVDTK